MLYLRESINTLGEVKHDTGKKKLYRSADIRGGYKVRKFRINHGVAILMVLLF